MLAKTDKESFLGTFEEWHNKWSKYLNERMEETGTGETHYTHKPLRNAYLSNRRKQKFAEEYFNVYKPQSNE